MKESLSGILLLRTYSNLLRFSIKRQEPGLYNALRLVFLSGDWIPLSLPPIINSNFPSAVVVGLGGATEATIWSNYFNY